MLAEWRRLGLRSLLRCVTTMAVLDEAHGGGVELGGSRGWQRCAGEGMYFTILRRVPCVA